MPIATTKPAKKISFCSLQSQDAQALADFFLSLRPQTLFLWNRFGGSFTSENAKKIAQEQIHKSPAEEQGFVAYAGNVLAGYSYLRFFPNKPQKMGTASLGIVIRDDYQNAGIGNLMMKEMIRFCKEKKLKKIWLSTYLDNKRTLYFYKRLGFLTEGIFMFDEYFDGKPRHVVSMARFLNPALQKKAEELKRRYL